MFTLNGNSDTPLLQPFSSRDAYRALHANDAILPGTQLIWGCRLPGKLKFVGWLVHFDRINSQANLFWKNIRALEDSICPAATASWKQETTSLLLAPGQ
jgi:hypothetical protein